MGEQPIFTTKAHVFQIDPVTKKKWLPASSEAVNISFYYDSQRSSYRIISVDNNKAIINSTILPSMTFTKTSQKFGQWSDSQANTVYGIGFPSEQDCTKFVDKFREVKEMVKSTSNGSVNMNGSDTELSTTAVSTKSAAPVTSKQSPNVSPQVSTTMTDSRRQSATDSGLLEQLKYENDRLKIALAQSSANAKKWEVELQTLKNNNARLTTALQESTANVEEWKKQLAAYKEESARMKRKVYDLEQHGGSGDQMIQLRTSLQELEVQSKNKDQDLNVLRRQVEELKGCENELSKCKSQLQTVQEENRNLRRELEESSAKSATYQETIAGLHPSQRKMESAVGDLQKLIQDMGHKLQL